MGNPKSDGGNAADMDSSILRSLRSDTSSEPRMLTPSEQASLRQHQIAVLDEAKALIRQGHSAIMDRAPT